MNITITIAEYNDANDGVANYINFTNKDTIAEWETPFSEIKLGKCAGSGSYGTVYKSYWHGPVAAKKLHFKKPTEKQLATFRNEVDLLLKCRHECIVMFMGACTVSPNFIIITEWCAGNTLYSRIHTDDVDEDLNLVQIHKVILDMSRGMG